MIELTGEIIFKMPDGAYTYTFKLMYFKLIEKSSKWLRCICPYINSTKHIRVSWMQSKSLLR